MTSIPLPSPQLSLPRGPADMCQDSPPKHLDVKDERLGVLLQGVQVGVAQGVVLVHLGDATAVPLALQGVLAGCDVA